MQLDPGTPTKVVIRTAAHVAIIPATVAEIVAPLLTADAPGIAGGRLLKARVSKEFFEFDDDGRVWTSAGLLPRITKHLESIGCDVEVDDRTTWLQYQKMN
ncbi:MAG TPA: hypothetical protein DD670_13400, partial [Planctomycetaceae bacterium]|nr:hypothetical protein [Planctomycetaceae bacterium]